MRRHPAVIVAVVVVTALVAGLWFGTEPLVRRQTADSVDPATGSLAVAGLSAPVSIRRDALGVPLIEAQNVEDLAFATGYAMAQDRLPQMVAMSLTAQGRLAEMVGDTVLPIDRYMRTLDVHRIAAGHYNWVPADLQKRLQKFSDGVNAYMAAHEERLPLPLRGYTPEPWTPLHSMDIYMLLNLGLSMNFHQEAAFLNLAAAVGPERAAWLLPTMPDEPLPLAEAAKLADIDFETAAASAATLGDVQRQLRTLLQPAGLAASNNWVIAPARTAGGASILANDTHLLLQHPPLWMLVQLRAPGYNAAGIAIAGVPGVVAGYNGKVAWGMTMVMADSQDIFVEDLRRNGDVTEYRVGNAWLPTETREEVFRIKGGGSERMTVHSTAHGPLVNALLTDEHIALVQPVPLAAPERYGLALSWTAKVPDDSLDAVWKLGTAGDFRSAQEAVRNIRYIHLNLVYADRDNIGWQVTGRYPKRKQGTGKFPSPGWSGEWDWDGWWDVSWLPAQANPVRGYIGTANDRKVPPGYPVVLSSSWFSPERGERIDELLASRSDHTAGTSLAMQADQVNRFALKLRRVLLTEPFSDALQAAIGNLPSEDSLLAMEAHGLLTGWDGNQVATSKAAAIFALFEDALPRQAFADELGGPADEDEPGSAAWQALAGDTLTSYSAVQDHLLGREDSPFWDDTGTEDVRETKADIVARTLAAATRAAEKRMGRDRSRWQWGLLHGYHWRSPGSAAREHLPPVERFLVDRLAPYLDRGPYPAGGSHNTLNVGGYAVGAGGENRFDVEVVPAMRMVVDFSAAEPLQLVIAGGQSADPASPHYDDGIAPWLATQNRVLPFNDVQARHAHFADEFVLTPAP
ncbi:MAG: penicillin acylase family protein [Pseudomonadota bacterium]